MRNISYIVIMCYFNIIFIHAQHPAKPYEMIEFKSINPIWYATAFDSASVSDVCDGYNRIVLQPRIKPVLDEEYSYFTYIHLEPQAAGFLIEKRRLSDGEQIWVTSRHYEDLGKQEIPVFSFLGESNTFVLLTQRRLTGTWNFPPLDLGGDSLRLVVRVYDQLTGNLLQESKLEDGDPTGFPTSYDRFTFAYKSSYFYPENGNYRYFQNHLGHLPPIFTSTLLDPYGRMMAPTDTLVLSQRQDRFLVERLYNGKYLILVEEGDSIFLRTYNATLDTLFASIQLKAFGKDGRLSLHGFTDTKILLENAFSDRKFILVYDGNGSLLSSTTIPTEYGQYVFRVINNEVYGFGVSEDLEFLKIDESGEIMVLKQIETLDNFRILFPQDFYLTGDNRILTINVEGAYFVNPKGNIERDKFAQATSLISFDATTLGIISSTFEISLRHKLSVFPNPVSQNRLYVSSPYELNTICFIYDATGRQLMAGVNWKDGIDISWLSQGIYTLMLQNDSGQRSTTFVKY